VQEKGLKVKEQHPVTVLFRGQDVGDFYADLFVEEKVMVELKAVQPWRRNIRLK
jgi:GxxExxY protein